MGPLGLVDTLILGGLTTAGVALGLLFLSCKANGTDAVDCLTGGFSNAAGNILLVLITDPSQRAQIQAECSSEASGFSQFACSAQHAIFG